MTMFPDVAPSSRLEMPLWVIEAPYEIRRRSRRRHRMQQISET